MGNPELKYSLIVRNLQEVIGDEELGTIVKREDAKKPLAVYWGTATTGKPHVAYFVPIIKIADMLHAGAKVTILFADLHAYLDNMKSPWNILCHRATYYETVIKSMLEAVGISLEQLHFIRGSDYELSKEYSQDVYRIMAETSIHDSRKAGAEVVKQVSNPLVSGLLYPLLQALDEVYLNVDAQFGGVDQRKIFMLAEKILPRLGYKKRIHLMNPMVPGLTGGKMSASEVDSKIDMLESSANMHQKLKRAVCIEGSRAADGNGVLSFLKFVIFPLVDLVSKEGVKCGDRTFPSYEALEEAFLGGELPSDALRTTVFSYLDARMERLREKFNQPEFKTLLSDAYPANIELDDSHLSDGASLTARHDKALSISLGKIAACEVSSTNKLTRESLSAVASLLPDCDTTHLAGLVKDKKHLRCLWSITPSGLPHLGHTLPLRLLARLSCIPGVHVIILIDDVAAFLEGRCEWKLREARSKFVEAILTATFRAFGGDQAALTVLHGGDYKFEGAYMLNLYHLAGLVSELDAARASGVSASADAFAPQTGGNNLAALIAPCLDLLDSYQLGADIRLAGPGRQALRTEFAEKFLPIFDPKRSPPCFASHQLLPSLALPGSAGQEDPAATVAPSSDSLMSAFFPATCDPLLAKTASAQAVAKAQADRCLPLIEPPAPGVPHASLLPGLKKRLKQCFCQPGNISVNPVLDIFKLCVMADMDPNAPIEISRPPEHGGPLTIQGENRMADLDSLFTSEQLHPGDLKQALWIGLTTGFQSHLAAQLPSIAEVVSLMDAAFPPPQKKVGAASKKIANSKDKTAMNERETAREQSNTQEPGAGKVKEKCPPFDPNYVELLVGKIISCEQHPNSAEYVVCKVSFGGERFRTSVIGLSDLGINSEALQGSLAVYCTNLQPALIDGIESQVRIICVPKSDEVTVLPLCPVGRRSEGDRVYFEKTAIKKSAKPVAPSAELIDPTNRTWEAFFQDIHISETNDGLVWKGWRLAL